MIKIFKIRPWRKTHINGPLVGMPVKKAAVLGKLIKKAKRPLLIVGGYEYETEIENGKRYIDYLIDLAKSGIPVVATTEVAKIFNENGVKPVAIMSVSNTIQRICDENWKGFDGNGPYDWVIIAAMTYTIQSQAHSAMKHFAYKWTKSVSLDRYLTPNADFSFANFKVDEWKEAIKEVIKIATE
ncbi:MAG: CO dehydrogenase/acetyl-CoA synthase complex subunit epsilon [Candidatus Lokiarchaeota archaeon]|nr:CO dehydrogenase/acetyl-CoA synthase complex subunit epsilon [Candidatus Lokiarchaeota archaeon]